jgi:CxxC motif-containing protein (DUF1111 family)
MCYSFPRAASASSLSSTATWLGIVILIARAVQVEGLEAPSGESDEAEAARVKLGRTLFNTEWVAAGTTGVDRHKGLGPLFNATSCNACHKDGGRAPGPTGDGSVPIGLEIQLESPSAQIASEVSGDPVYGRVFNTSAVDGVQSEGVVTVQYREIEGYYYPDGMRWHMRVPHYHLTGLSHGPLARTTVIKPRVAPSLFGAGQLEAVLETEIRGDSPQTRDRISGKPAWHRRQGSLALGRFGWQGDAISIRDQTAKALALDMGLTSTDRRSDDCTPAEADCLQHANGEVPEVSEEELEAIVAFVRTLEVRGSSAPTGTNASLGSALFVEIGCAGCHRPQLTVALAKANGSTTTGLIAPYTDLLLHDLGMEMADEDVSGSKIPTKWRTAPLWGARYRVKIEPFPTFMHDGRARSTEEAILWHSGEAARSRRAFLDLGPRSRAALLRWLESL